MEAVEDFNPDAICLGIRRALIEGTLAAYSLARRDGCCCWLEKPVSWLEALALLVENGGVSYSGFLEEAVRRACGLPALRLLEAATARLI